MRSFMHSTMIKAVTNALMQKDDLMANRDYMSNYVER